MMNYRRPLGLFARQSLIEWLEPRRLLAADVKLAVIGDYSIDNGSQPERDVANLVQSWSPTAVVTVGDNNYPNGAASTIDANIGQYYHQYISPYKGTYGAGSADGQNHFWPALGNHDWDPGTAQPYTDYFTLPGNERYYTTQVGNVGIFVVDSDPHEPDGNTSTSVQGTWLKSALAASTAKWKLVFFHHPPYSSSIASNTWMQWPFAQWGATAVFSGHDHVYERLSENGIPYFVDGLGGESIFGFGTPVAGSQVRYANDYGAMLLDAASTSLNFQFITRTGAVIDSYTLGTPATPAAPTNLTATAASTSQINLAWANTATNATGVKIDRSADGINFTTIATVAGTATSYADSGLPGGTSYSYRVRTTNAAGDSANSNVAVATTLPQAGGTVYASDLPWVSATSGWGTVQKDKSVGGNALKLRGTTYTKGLGTHAVSNIAYNLNGQYTNFLSDIGIDDEELTKGTGSVDFQVVGDGKVLYDSGVLTNASPVIHVNVNVSGVKQLTLVANNGVAGSIDFDHADWAGARLLSTGTLTAPPAPTGLTAAAASATQVNLAWTESSNNVTSFTIERGTDGTTFAPVGTVAGTVTAFADTTVSGGGTYFYRVKATNSAGASPYSNVASAAPLAPPTAPTGLVATPVSGSQVNLSWTESGTNQAGFKVERSTDGVNFTLIATPDNTSRTYTDVAVSVNTLYYYRVKATNAAGDSAYSNVATATTPNATATTYVSDLTWVSATNGWGPVEKNMSNGGQAAGDGKTITLHGVTFAKGLGTNSISQVVYNLNGQYANFLSDIGIDDEEIGKGTGTVDFQVVGDGKVLYDSGVMTNTSATQHVNVPVSGVQQLTLAVGDAGDGNAYDHGDWAGARLTGTPPATTPPASPTGLTAAASGSYQVNLAWANAATNATGVKIDRSTDGGVTFTTIATVAGTATSYADANLSPGTTYTYRVRTTNAAGDSANSNVASATTAPIVTGGTTYLSDLPWVSATTGWGTVQKDLSVGGHTLTLRGTTYAKGIGTHAVSNIVYNLAGKYTTFQSDIGIDDEENGKGTGSVDFQVIGDGKVLFDSGVLTNLSPVVHVNVSVAGVQQLTLVATNGVAGNIDYDHADWAGARLVV